MPPSHVLCSVSAQILCECLCMQLYFLYVPKVGNCLYITCCVCLSSCSSFFLTSTHITDLESVCSPCLCMQVLIAFYIMQCTIESKDKHTETAVGLAQQNKLNKYFAGVYFGDKNLDQEPKKGFSLLTMKWTFLYIHLVMEWIRVHSI